MRQIGLEFGRRFPILHWMFTIACHYLIYIFLPHVSVLRRINYFVEWYLQLFYVSKKSCKVFEWLLRRKMRYYVRKSEEKLNILNFQKSLPKSSFSRQPPFFRGNNLPPKTSMGRVLKIFFQKIDGLKFSGFEGYLPVTKYHYDPNENRKKNFGEWTLRIKRVKTITRKFQLDIH